MKKLSQDSRGNFKVEKGSRGNRVTFYLGKDESEAQIRAIKIEQLWEIVARDFGGDWGRSPIGFTGLTLKQMGNDIGAGRTIEAPISNSKPLACSQLYTLHQEFPMATFAVPSDVSELAKERGEARIASGLFLKYGFKDSINLHAALDQFKAYLSLKKKAGSDELREGAKNSCWYVDFLKQHIKDCDLAELDWSRLEEIKTYFENRPMGKRGTPLAVHTCQDSHKTLRAFLRWAVRTRLWTEPEGETAPFRVVSLPAELQRMANPEQVLRYKRPELALLYKYATPLERVFILLGLNCGFAPSELSKLPTSAMQGSYIKFVRPKTGVYGEWLLWPETRQAIEWYKGRRPKSDRAEFLLTKKGEPYYTGTKSGNRSMKFANLWARLTRRIQKDEPNFRRLPIKAIRKTAGNIIRNMQGGSGEIMRVFHCRGTPVKLDEHSEVYANRPFRKVFKALKRAHAYLRPMFAASAEPFTDKVTRPSLSLGTIEKIKGMKGQGMKPAEIGRTLGISRETVRYHV